MTLRLIVFLFCLLPKHGYGNFLQACVDVTHQTLIGIKLFDWDRTGDHDPLGRLKI